MVTLNFVFSSTEWRNAVLKMILPYKQKWFSLSWLLLLCLPHVWSATASSFECLHFWWRNAPSWTAVPEQIVLWAKGGDTQKLVSNFDSHSSWIESHGDLIHLWLLFVLIQCSYLSIMEIQSLCEKAIVSVGETILQFYILSDLHFQGTCWS